MANDLAGTPPPPGMEEYVAGDVAPASQPQGGQHDPYNLAGTPPPIGMKQELYGGIGQQAIAGLEGVARGASLGTSDIAEQALGVPQEDIKGRMAANPWTSGVSNAAGAGALVYLTGGVAAPAEAFLAMSPEAIEIGMQAARAAEAAGATGEAVAAIGQQAANAAARASSSLSQRALAYGAEGAVFGAGNTISDYSLGDPNLTGGKILANVGLGALFGAGLGAGSKFLENKGIIGKKIADVAAEEGSKATTAQALSGTEPLNPGPAGGAGGADKPSIFGTKPDAAETLKVAKKYDLNISEGFTSSDPFVQRGESALRDQASTIVGVIKAKQAKDTWDKMTGLLTNDVLGTGEKFGGGELTQANLGEYLQNSHIAQIEQTSAPLNAAFESLKSAGIEIPVAKDAANRAVDEILKLPEIKSGFSDADFAKKVAARIPGLQTAEDVRAFQSNLGNQLPTTASKADRHMVGVLSDKLEELANNSIEQAAHDPQLQAVPEVQQEMLKLIPEIKAAKKQWGLMRNDLNTFTEQLGKKNTGGPQGAIDFLKNLDVEDLSTKLLDKKYTAFNKFYADKFPGQAEMLRLFEKQNMLKAASNNARNQFNPFSFFKKVESLQPEIRAQIFTPDELLKIKESNQILKNYPENYNPSNTANTAAFTSFFDVGKAAIMNARDFGILAYIKAAGSLPENLRPNPYELGTDLGNKFNTFNAIEKMNDAVDTRIKKESASIFGRDFVRGAAIGAGAQAGRKINGK